MIKRCFICHRKEDPKTGLCTNKKCIRSKPIITEKADKT
jgi:hypothetical protein